MAFFAQQCGILNVTELHIKEKLSGQFNAMHTSTIKSLTSKILIEISENYLTTPKKQTEKKPFWKKNLRRQKLKKNSTESKKKD